MELLQEPESVDTSYYGCLDYNSEKNLGNIYFLNDDKNYRLTPVKKAIYLDQFGIIANQFNLNLYDSEFKDSMLKDISSFIDLSRLKDSVDRLEKELFDAELLMMRKDSIYLWPETRPRIKDSIQSDFFKIYRKSKTNSPCTSSIKIILFINKNGNIDSLNYVRKESPDVMKAVEAKINEISYYPALNKGRPVNCRFSIQFGIYSTAQ